VDIARHLATPSLCSTFLPSSSEPYCRAARISSGRYLGHAVRKNVTDAYGAAVLKPDVTDPPEGKRISQLPLLTLPHTGKDSSTEFAGHWIHPGITKSSEGRWITSKPGIRRAKHLLTASRSTG
jgi:hypothetical protein